MTPEDQPKSVPSATSGAEPIASDQAAPTGINLKFPGVPDKFQRLASALVLMPVAIGSIWAGGLWAALAASLAAALMAYEWIRLVAPGRWGRLAFIYAVAFAFAFGAGSGGTLRPAIVGLTLGAVSATAWAALSGRTDRQLMAGVGVIYIGFPCLMFISWEPTLAQSSLSLIGLFCTVWAADTGALVVGARLGRHPLAPRISPMKTWEGLVGGMFAAGIAGALWCTLLDGMAPWVGFLIGLGVGLVAELGDMLESAAKRSFGVKDMSGLIPGHGGVLDRLDSLLLVISIAGIGAAIWMR